MKVLTISVDVSDLSDTQIEELQLAMEVQTEDYDSPDPKQYCKRAR